MKLSPCFTLFAALAALSTPAFGATVILVNDTFSDGERLTDSGGTPQTSLDWSIRGSAPTGSVSGGTFNITPSALITTNFTAVTLSSTVTSVTVSFDFSVATITSLTTWRFGLINSPSHLTTDTTGATNGSATYQGATGYSFIGGIGNTVTASSWRLGRTDATVTNGGANLSNSGTNAQIGSVYSTVAMTPGATYQASMTFTRETNGSLSISSTVAGFTFATVNEGSPITLSFNNFWMLSSQQGALSLDNFRITTETAAIPEPSSAALLAGSAILGGTLALRRRRGGR